MICQLCDNEMELENQYFYATVNSNNHYKCPKCSTICVEHIRLSVPYRQIWRYKNGKKWEVDLG